MRGQFYNSTAKRLVKHASENKSPATIFSNLAHHISQKRANLPDRPMLRCPCPRAILSLSLTYIFLTRPFFPHFFTG